MKFEKITDDKIQIFLSLFDLESNNISINNIFSNSANSQQLLQNLLNTAENEIGFKVEDSELLVEIILSSDQKCVFTITKLCKRNLIVDTNLDCLIFEFDNFEHFIDLCNFVKNIPNLKLEFSLNNFSLILYNNTYYLQITNIKYLSTLTTICSEFGKNIINNFSLNSILNEYGKIIFEKNAFLQCINNF